MMYQPLESDYGMFAEMTGTERMLYTTTRIVESEEVWSLGNENGWLIREQDDRQFISIWPYRQLALQHVDEGSDNPVPQATSLEYFVYGILDMCTADDIWLEIFPYQGRAGQLIRSDELFEILNGMLETNDYFIEG